MSQLSIFWSGGLRLTKSRDLNHILQQIAIECATQLANFFQIKTAMMKPA